MSHKCKACPWFFFSDHLPPRNESLGICKYYHLLRNGGLICKGENYEQIQEAYLIYLENEEKKEGKTKKAAA